ncbi:hypothetical protein KAK07_16905 [Ideonella sp. 4Y16]|uniref:Uncharacterized protein n=1 Tax=Ideonella alba TaxID=2824118 RepID=A0A940YDY6_9BURK|nr:hypothetical protein [Ideonella alba]MBQ0931391.1 hypothetical protein [Ideonella alba]MBQ0945021.1 hypothetical protein [Ideonella alba]
MFRRTPTPSAPAGRWLARLMGWRPATAPSSTLARMDVRPPARWGQADSVWQSLWQWLREDAQTAEPHPGPKLTLARQDFCTALNGLLTRDAQDLRQRAAHARSLRELWHLRAELYGLIARHLDQREAERRLVAVNRHFPVDTRAVAQRSALPHGHDHAA